MNQKKNTRIILILMIIVMVIILALGGLFAYLYFATDILKSNKELFFKYSSQAMNAENGLVNNGLKEYFAKKQNTPYESQGKITTNANIKDNKVQQVVDNFTITYKGKTDNLAESLERTISLNYSDKVKFPINYRKIGDVVGLEANSIINRFIAVDTSNTENLPSDVVSQATALAAISKVTAEMKMDDEKKQEFTDFKNNLYEKLSNEKFTKVEDQNGKGYKLTLTEEELDRFFEDDSDNYFLGNTIDTSDSVTNLKERLDDLGVETEKIEITIYGQNDIFNKLIASADGITLSIENVTENGSKGIRVSLELDQNGSEISAFLNVNYKGLSSMQTVQETYEIEVQVNDALLGYNIENVVNFTDNVDIEEFTGDNSLRLNDYGEEAVSNFMLAVTQRVTDVNAEQMQELGLEESYNPLITPITNFIGSLIQQMMGVSMSDEDVNNLFWSDQKKQLNEAQIAEFNSEYEIYEDSNLPGVTTKGMLSIIDSNNESDKYEYKIKEINFKGNEYDATKENIAFIKGDILTDVSYRVEFEQDPETGAIFRVVINEK